MFDYVTAQEIRLLCKLQIPGYKLHLSSNQRLRLELLGLLKDCSNGIQLTSKGARVIRADYVSEDGNDFEPQLIRLPD